jgi:hypothetical protein
MIDAGERVAVSITKDDGEIIDFAGLVSSLSCNMHYDGLVTLDLEITGTAKDIFNTTADEKAKKYKKRKEEKEWLCIYCGTVNNWNDKVCGENVRYGCDARRPWEYD